MKTQNPITLWDKIEQAVVNLTETDDVIAVKNMTEKELVENLIELAYHFRLEYKRLLQEKEDNAWM